MRKSSNKANGKGLEIALEGPKYNVFDCIAFRRMGQC